MRLLSHRKRPSDPYRAHIERERERVRRAMTERGREGRVPETLWWKEWLGIGTNREWVFVSAFLGFFVAWLQGGGAAGAVGAVVFTVGGLVVNTWLRKRKQLQEDRGQESVLRLRDREGDRSASSD